MRGVFVAIDGPGGSGKSTLIVNLTKRLTEMGVALAATAEPSRGEIGRLARTGTNRIHGLALACLVAADRYHHMAEEIRPALAEGRVVLCDRYTLSSLVLQGIDGVPEEFIRAVNADAEPPDLQVVLTAPPEILRHRLRVRGSHGRFEDDPALSEREVRLCERAAAASMQSGVRTVVLDTDRGPEDIEMLVSDLTTTIRALSSHATPPP